MDFLKSIAGMFTSSVLRLAVAVGIIVAIYFFAIRPVLDTTNKAIDSASSFQSGADGGNISRQIQRSINQTNRRVQRQIRRSFRQTPSNVKQKRLLRCVQRAQGNANQIQRCARRF